MVVMIAEVCLLFWQIPNFMHWSVEAERFLYSRDIPSATIEHPVVPILGKSNVGKSSLINLLLGQKLARQGKRPGLTESIGLYKVTPGSGDPFYIGDMPGFGFAVGGVQREQNLSTIIKSFLQKYRRNILFLIYLIDSRRALDGSFQKENPREDAWIELCIALQLPFMIVITKTDKVGKNKIFQAKKQVASKFQIDPADLYSVSIKDSQAIEDLRAAIVDQVADAIKEI